MYWSLSKFAKFLFIIHLVIYILIRQLKKKQVDNFDASAMLLMKQLPLISKELAEDKKYLSLHPYIIASREKYFAMPTGKQRALEVSFY
jgi:hypothetical protein